MSGNLYAMVAGMALQTASAIKKGQNQRAQMRYQDAVQKANIRQNAINKMAKIKLNSDSEIGRIRLYPPLFSVSLYLPSIIEIAFTE